MKTVSTLMLMVLLTVTAHAETPDGEKIARQHFELGQKKSAAGRYTEAFQEFESGYQWSHRPLFLFNMAECARLGGDLAGAREKYERYLAEDPEGSLAATARARLSLMGFAPAPVPLQPAPPPESAAPLRQPSAVPSSPPPMPSESPVDGKTRASTRDALKISAIFLGATTVATAAIGVGLVASVEVDAPKRAPACMLMRCDVSDLFARRYAGEAFLAIAGAAAVVDVALWVAHARHRRSDAHSGMRPSPSGLVARAW